MLLEGTMNLIPVFTMSHHSAFAQGGGRIKFVFRDQKPLIGILRSHLLYPEQSGLHHDNRLLANVREMGVSLLVSEHNPSPGTPQGRMRMTELLLSIQFLEMSLPHLLQVFQRLFGRYPFSRQNVLETLTELIQGYISRDHHQGITELDQHDFTALRELMFFSVGSRNGNLSFLSYADCTNRSGQRFRHKQMSSWKNEYQQSVVSPKPSDKRNVSLQS